MLTGGSKTVFLLVVIFSLYNCIEPYLPDLPGYESLLVVDGQITDENVSNTISLSRTFQDKNGIPEAVNGASVFISDDAGRTSYLSGIGKGVYKTDSTEFRGSVGKTYVLHVITEDGEEYESDKCQMLDVPEIDSIYFEKDRKLINNDSEAEEGIMIYIDTKGGDNSRYYRWGFEESWKFRVPDPKKFIYISETNIVMNPDVREYCWKGRKSGEIVIRQVYSGESGSIKKEPLFFIAPGKSDRLLLRYSILIKQYSISKSEYEFWNNLEKLNEQGDDIFASQPYSISCNIHNISNPEERILGFFRVSSVKQKRKYIDGQEIVKFNFPYFHYECVRVEFSPTDFPWNLSNPPLTWDDVDYMFESSGYYFVEPKYLQGTQIIDRLVFTKPECADCLLTGTFGEPDFWIDTI